MSRTSFLLTGIATARNALFCVQRMRNPQRLSPVSCRHVPRMNPGDASDKGSRHRRNSRPAPQSTGTFVAANEAKCSERGGHRSRKHAACSHDPTARPPSKRIQRRLLTAFNSPSFPGFKNRSSEPKHLQGSALSVTHQFENPHCCG